ncbi:hypothetical protein HKX48_004561 [Thoreauomyces humboldtii]|nr:hypothetical protein HKX48_004561 [Thoreauomyces humboldtii]
MSCTIYAVLFPSSCRATAKQFWQHSGEGISTRFAQHCLAILDANEQAKNFAAPVQGVRGMTNAQYRAAAYVPEKQMAHLSAAVHAAVRSEHDLFVEERYGRNMDPKDAVKAKSTVRQRIAGVLGDSEPLDAADAGSAKEAVGRSVPNIRDSDVYLFPTGMSAIYNTHRLVRKLAEGRKSVQFGFPYIDTLKIQEKIGPGCHFLGFGDQNDIDRLEREILPSETISAVFCELPSNPLLRTPNLIRLRELADQHGFLIVVDETVGNFVNVAAAKWADVLVSSLTKIFSGDSNVMGGSAVISPSSPRYAELSDAMSSLFEDTLWFEDAIFLERNSRTFIQRIRTINTNAEYLCHYLRSHPKVQEVHYPKYVDTQLYELLSRPLTSGEDKRGFGGLFSLIMGTDEDARNLFDSLEIAKGPSLGTNFTLACPYTILAHYTELDWAAKYNVPARLIRVSVGLESKEDLVSVFEKALASLSPTPV